MSTNDIGNVSESIVLTAYISAGFSVPVPFGNGCAYDLVVDTGTRLLKVQVKTAWQRKGCLNFKGQRRIRDSKQNGMRRYKEGEVDFFAVYFPPSSSIYVVPFGVVSGEGCLRLAPVLNGQQKLVKWAAEYTWEKHIDCLRTEMFPAKGSISLSKQ